MSRRFRRSSLYVFAVLTCLMASCSVSSGVGPEGGFLVFEVGGRVFTFTFGNVGPIAVEAGRTTQVATDRGPIFESTPTDRPPKATTSLPSSEVGVFGRRTGKAIVRSQALPLSGTATVTLLIAPGSSDDPCADGITLAEYDIVLTTGIASVVDEIAELSEAALAIVLTNDITICIQIEADFDGEFEIGTIEISFGTDEDPTPPGTEEPPPPTTGTTLQVPIDNEVGQAVVAPVTDTIRGVDYGVVGVIDARTPDAPDAGVPDYTESVSIDLNDLGLESVDRLYMGTHSAWVPDLPDGFKLATLTCSYAEGGSPTTLDLVMGTNTAEWSYDRPEHDTMFGGVQHARPLELYSFQTTIDSASEYTGYVYSVSLDLDPTRTLSCVSLTMVSQSVLAGGTAGDDDGDGVGDESDECPNTPAGTEVDTLGCPVEGGVTVDETFTGLAEGTGGSTESPESAADVPDSILTVIDEATALGGSYDMLFIIDATGSMSDDISAVKARLDEIIDAMIANGDGTQRAGVVTYQDLCNDGENSTVKLQELTNDLELVRDAINGISTGGGGDLPESVYDAIVFSMDPDNFTFVNPNRFALVIGDAPPQSPGNACYRASFTDAVNATTAAGVDANLYPIIVPLAGGGVSLPIGVARAKHNYPDSQGSLMKVGPRLARPLVDEPTWAGQAFSAITLEGPAGTPSTVGACPDDGGEGGGEGLCTEQADCADDEICTPDGVCIPGDFSTDGILGEDCSSDGVCNADCGDTDPDCLRCGDDEPDVCMEGCPGIDPDCTCADCPGECFDGICFARGEISYTDAVITYNPTFGGNDAPSDTNAATPENAIGAPDYDGSFATHVTLGQGGLIELAFTDNVLTNSGDSQFDLRVFEVGPDVEATFVAVRATGGTGSLLTGAGIVPDGEWFEVGRIEGSTRNVDIDAAFPGFDPGELEFDAVRLIDDKDQGGGGQPTPGADIDAVGAIATRPV
ncbi:MAG: VWA domain-containing protein [bacterium]|nr:VWA domain-containing protein [bacterium]